MMPLSDDIVKPFSHFLTASRSFVSTVNQGDNTSLMAAMMFHRQEELGRFGIVNALFSSTPLRF